MSIEERSKLIRKRDRRNEYELNDAGYEIISRINGKKTFHHLLEELSTRYSDTLEHVEVVVTKYLKTLKEEYGLEIL
ncbi:MAG: PqqD family protein [Lachnospiraceae bacterium]|nr:PqqD family protein [Lachnospiraceae bacterium]